MFEKIRSFPYIKEVAFIFAIVLILYAWKFGIEGIAD